MAHRYGPKIVRDNSLVFAIDARNGKSYVSGSTVVTDLTINKTTASLINGVGFDNKSWTFDGVNDYINCDSLIPLIENDTQGTVESWVKINDNSPIENKHVFMGGELGDDEHIALTCLTNGKLRANCRLNGVVQWNIASDNTVFQNGEYCHVAVVQDGVLPKIYFNGELIPQSTISNTDTTLWFNDITLTSNNIGIRITDVTQGHWDGDIGVFKYYNRPLTASEVKQNYEELKYRFI